jgi:hypothetical protein
MKTSSAINEIIDSMIAAHTLTPYPLWINGDSRRHVRIAQGNGGTPERRAGTSSQVLSFAFAIIMRLICG